MGFTICTEYNTLYLYTLVTDEERNTDFFKGRAKGKKPQEELQRGNPSSMKNGATK